MAIPFEQLVAATYDDVVNEKNKAADQWSDSSFLKSLERLGGVKKISGGATLQVTLDYKQNPNADFLALDTTTTSTTKTEVLTAASYDLVPLVVPVNWSFFDEAVNSEKNQKVDLVSSIVDNALTSHDQAIEDALFAATGGTDGFNTLVDIYTEDGTGTVGTIVSGTETWWKNKFKDWGTDTGATLIGDYVTLYNSCAKGSGGRKPNVIVGHATMHANYEAALVANQRFVSVSKGDGGFTELAFKTIPYIFTSESNDADVAFMFNTADTKLYVVMSAWRQRRKVMDHVNAAMSNMKIFSVCQLATRNRSRGGVIFS
ncbi:MAG TPA: phage major capsid protein [Tepidisphaeraceae bacterium]|nr:phage major capsid protein [Tepidisphaeraceae bacterium]